MIDIEGVLKYLRVVRGMQPNTLRTIELWLKRLEHIETQEQFIDFIDDKSKVKADTTVNGYIVAFHHYIDYLQYNDLPCPFRKIKTKRVHTKPVMDFLSPVEIKSIIEAHVVNRNGSQELGTVLDTFYLFLSLTGCRVSEATNLYSKDVSIAGKFCWVTLKGGRRHKFVLPDHLCEKLDLSHEYVFVNTKFNKLEPSDIRKNLTKRAKLVGLDPRRVHPHAFRHSYISSLLKEGVNLDIIAKLVGHAKLDTTYKTYAHLLDDSLRDAQNHHPLIKEFLTPQEIIKQDLVAIRKLRIFHDERIFPKLIEGSHSLELLVAVK